MTDNSRNGKSRDCHRSGTADQKFSAGDRRRRLFHFYCSSFETKFQVVALLRTQGLCLLRTSTPGWSGSVLVVFVPQSGSFEWLICSGLLLLGVARRRWNELENLVRHQRSVRKLLSRRVDNVARAESDLLRCNFCDRNIWRNGDRLGAVLVINYEPSYRRSSGLFRSSCVSARQGERRSHWSFCCE